jgi:hypothetical protein
LRGPYVDAGQKGHRFHLEYRPWIGVRFECLDVTAEAFVLSIPRVREFRSRRTPR